MTTLHVNSYFQPLNPFKTTTLVTLDDKVLNRQILYLLVFFVKVPLLFLISIRILCVRLDY